MNSVKLGIAAEHIFIAKCLLAEYDCYVPVAPTGRIDVIVGDRLAKCQVKAISDDRGGRDSKGLTVRKVGCNSKTNTKIYRYTSSDVDFMIGVDMINFDIYAAPMRDLESLGYKHTVSISVMRELGYRNNIELIGQFELAGALGFEPRISGLEPDALGQTKLHSHRCLPLFAELS